jgi:hypothetical protein
MSEGFERMNPNLRDQYTAAYGPYVAGEYEIGQRIRTRRDAGEIIWCYQSPRQGLVYVLDTDRGWPVAVKASEVIAEP